jgi:uncharacterized membrane protein YbhN (UPF0104 family)
MGTVVVDRAFDVFVLVTALVTVAPFVRHPGWLYFLLAITVAAGIGLIAGLVIAARRAGLAGSRATHLVAGTLRARAWTAIDSFTNGLATIRSAKDAGALLFLTAAAWGSWAFAAWCCTHAVGVSLGLLGVIFLTAVVNLGVSIPSSSGFVGTYQWLCVSALSVFSIGRSDAFAFAVVLHAMSLIPVTLVGYAVLAWMTFRPTRSRHESLPGSRAPAGTGSHVQ